MPSPLPSGASPDSSTSLQVPPGRRLDIQGLRALAVLMVVAFHAGLPVPGGFVGVDVFFVISGFVITGMLAREWARSGQIHFGRFYLRRFKRLTPALALTVAVTVTVSAVTLSPLGAQQDAAKTGIGAMLLVANAVVQQVNGGYFGASAATNPLLNTWSLSVEEQFYLAFPLMLWLGWIVARRIRVLRIAPLVLVGIVAALSFGLTIYAESHRLPFAPSWAFGFYSPLSRAWEFALGALLAILLNRRSQISRLTGLTAGSVGAALLVASLVLIGDSTPYPGFWTLLPVTGALLLLWAGSNDSNAVTRSLATLPMVRVGDWSYSIYLWHWPFIVVASAIWPNKPLIVVVAAALSMAPALASYYRVEQPIRAMSGLTRPRTLGLVLVTVTPALALSLLLLVASGHGYWYEPVKRYVAAISPWHATTVSGCEETPMSQRQPGSCEWNSRGTGAPIYLVGDSNAGHFSEAVIGAGERLDRPVFLSVASACPFVDVPEPRPGESGADNETCRNFVQGTLQWLNGQLPGVVIVSMNSGYFGGDQSPRLLDEISFKDGLSATITSIKDAGHKVLLVQTVPHFAEPYQWDPRLCSFVTVIKGECKQEMPVGFVVAAQASDRSAMHSVAIRAGATVLDVNDHFCSESGCVTETDGSVLYRDAGHISVAASEALAPAFAKAIQDLRAAS